MKLAFDIAVLLLVASALGHLERAIVQAMRARRHAQIARRLYDAEHNHRAAHFNRLRAEVGYQTLSGKGGRA